ncbi:nucleoside binding-domain containing protein [Aquipluma nitroreducens]|uniref:Nucleoside binding-domain containing protein n=1 Tax=Aquipluma nitroreducens TaxID=2010828 RepID=A0A5K7SDJ6_9BACT|nr:nucleoside recognition domain-containing protein [Aquipluma nitroreducens]BBE19536.1 nucleoside binding-domain containing protein [Aquipluma nitroreducens]
MGNNNDLNIQERLLKSVKTALPQGMKTAIWLLKLTIPVSFAVFLLDFFGILNVIAGWVAPLFKLIGLSGQASIVLITSFFTNIYSVIAVMTTLGFGFREGTILAVMCLISHALIVETAIQKKTGSSPWRMIFTRLSASFIAAFMLNFILPAEAITNSENVVRSVGEFTPALTNWLSSMLVTTIKIVVLVNLLLIIQKILNEFGLIKWILMPFVPLLKVMGLPSSTGFLWIVANTLGLGYGGAIMISETEEGKLSRDDADLLNHNIAISHSQLEDPLLFVAVGYHFGILIWPRILLAIIFVWIRRFEIWVKKSKNLK